RQPAGEPRLDWFASGAVDALQARGQRRRVVGDDEIARSKQGGYRRAGQMRDRPVSIGDEQLGEPPIDLVGGGHALGDSARGAFSRSAASIEVTISRAASSGRFRVAGSASGTAKA